MEVSITRENDELHVSVAGRLDTTTAPELERKLMPELGEAKKIIIDMAELEYISSAGLRILLRAAQSLDDTSDLTVKNVNEDIMGIFDVTGFSDILTVQQ